MTEETWSQAPYRCRLDWGRRGAREAARRGDVLVVVDTLSFSTAVATAVDRGGIVYPCQDSEGADVLAGRIGAEIAVRRQDVPRAGRFSLSPFTYLNLEPGTRVVLPSPNGGTCSLYGRQVPYLFVGALVNAFWVAARVAECLRRGGNVTVLACGERWRDAGEDGYLRPAVEDYLGAGAILSHLEGSRSPEAAVCEAAFRGARGSLEHLIWDCASGRELRAAGYEADVTYAAQLQALDVAPVMQGDALVDFSGEVAPPTAPSPHFI